MKRFPALIVFVFLSSFPSLTSSPLNVHIVAHVHTEYGYKKTADAYYNGFNSSIDTTALIYAFENLLFSLEQNTDRTFVLSEVGFFRKWFLIQSEETQSRVLRLIDEKRLFIANGGYVINDEATTHFNDILCQYNLGYQFTKDNLGIRPSIGWLVDTKGHSLTHAAFMSAMGFDAIFVTDIGHSEYEARKARKELEFVWRPDTARSDIFTHVMFDGYTAPEGFCFDDKCEQVADPIQDDLAVENYNVDERAMEFLAMVQTRAGFYRGNDVFVPMGGDFYYENPVRWYRNIDLLIRYFRENTKYGLNVFYSTPLRYMKAKNALKITWPVKKNTDFYPFDELTLTGEKVFHTGYFSTESMLKRTTRVSGQYVLNSGEIDSFPHMFRNIPFWFSGEHNETNLQKVSAELQHHTAITGAASTYVTADFLKRVKNGTDDHDLITLNLLQLLLTPIEKENEGHRNYDFRRCTQLLTNSSDCFMLEMADEAIAVFLYNAMSQTQRAPVRFPLADEWKYVEVLDDRRNTVSSEIITTTGLSGVKNQIVFPAEIPALGWRMYYMISYRHSCDGCAVYAVEESVFNEDVLSISNEKFTVSFEKNTGDLLSVENVESGVLKKLASFWKFYTPNAESTKTIYSPNKETVEFIDDVTLSSTVNGRSVQEVRQILRNNDVLIYQITRVYPGEPVIEVDYTLFPLSSAENGLELVYSIALENMNGDLYTDSNGRYLLRRQRKCCDISSNTFPMTTSASLVDQPRDVQFTLFTDRSYAVTSLNSNEMEVLVHRQFPGNASPYEAIRGQFYIDLDRSTPALITQRLYSFQRYNELLPMFSWISTAQFSKIDAVHRFADNVVGSFTSLKKEMPVNVHFSTIHHRRNETNILRVAHLFGKNDGTYSEPMRLDIREYMKGNVISIVEHNLPGTTRLDEYSRMKWTSELAPDALEEEIESDGVFTIYPMEIRTFLITFNTTQEFGHPN